jgi:hypothetical protein
MTRRLWMTLAAALAACGEKATLPADLFPQTVNGVWNRTELRDLPVDESPDLAPRNSVKQIRAASYKGPGDLNARVYLLDSAEAGATLATGWRPSADTVFFDHGQYFVVIKWQSPDRKALQGFVAALEKKLGAAGKK